MNAEALCRRVTEFGFKLLEHEFALDAQQHIVSRKAGHIKELMWARDGDKGLMVSNPFRIADYLALVEGRQYSYIMRDGAIIQIAFVIKDGSILKHRLALYPCPFEITEVDLRRYQGGIVDYITDHYANDLGANLVLKSPIRFDFAPDAAKEYHPASHITINDPDCRIPVRAPLSFDTFMKFILENFYLDVCAKKVVMASLHFVQEPDCLSAHDQARAFLHWTHS